MREDADLVDEFSSNDLDAALPARPHRPNGRNTSRRSILTRRLVEQALERGESPLHILLENAAWFRSKALDLERELAGAPANPTIDEAARLREKFKALLAVRKLATDVAAAAAPYCHPRLNSISVETEGDGPITFQIVGDNARL